jgi:DNA polymerase III sliding clamp (beta) subunit (PCNA family)
MNRMYLVKTLEMIKPALATNNIVPIFQCYVFGMGCVEAYNDTIAITGPCDIEQEFAIHGNTLLGLLSNSKAEEVSFEFTKTDVSLTMGKSVSKLPYMPKENFIFEAPVIEVKKALPITENFMTALELCLNTVSTDTTQMALLGVTLHGKHLYSCDGDALTKAVIPNSMTDRVLMPTAFCEAAIKIWKSMGIIKGTLAANKEWVYMDFGDWHIYGRVLEIPKPIDFDAEITKTTKGQKAASMVPEGLTDALSRARVLADPESQKTQIAVSKGKLRLLTETHMGQVKDEMPMKGHPDIEINVNAAHLQRALEHCEQIAFLENCTVLEAPDVLQVVSNMG